MHVMDSFVQEIKLTQRNFFTSRRLALFNDICDVMDDVTVVKQRCCWKPELPFATTERDTDLLHLVYFLEYRVIFLVIS